MNTRAVVLRLYPKREQQQSLHRWQGCLRFVWNKTLAWMFEQREAAGKWPNKPAIQTFIVALKREPESLWLADVPAHALLALADDVHRAFRNWFEKRAKKPRFRGKCKRQFSVYMVNQNTAFTDVNRVKLPKLGEVRFRAGDLPQGRLLSSRVWQEARKWYMSSVFECEQPELDIAPAERVGVDMGLKTLATVFDGSNIYRLENPKALKKHEQRLARYQRRLARQQKGSNRRAKQKRKIGALHQKTSNIRKDAAHKATNFITNLGQEIVVESLNVKGMLRNRHQAKAVADAAMGEALRQIKYKAGWKGRSLVEASPWYPSSQFCSVCGEQRKIMATKRLDVLHCDCGNVMQRDDNASRNLFAYREELGNVGFNAGKRVETGEQAAGFPVQPVPVDEARMLKRCWAEKSA